MQRVGKMGEALIQAQRSAVSRGVNTGRLGRLILTAEASMMTKKDHQARKIPALLKKVA
jgi:hypothetical protein